MYDIITYGCPVVEFVRTEIDINFHLPGNYLGPFPSGDTAITVNVASRLGQKCAYLGIVGDDSFGQMWLQRLRENGVDISSITIDPNHHTGVVFVAYCDSGDRHFYNTYQDSAGSKYQPNDIPWDVVQRSKWIHLTGVMLWANENSYRSALSLLESADPRVKFSFDPNYRPETMVSDDVKEIFEPFLRRADILFPSKNEAKLIMAVDSDDLACRKWAQMGKTVVLKEGPSGCTIYSGEQVLSVPTYDVDVIDVTGCGDSFCGGFLSGILQGLSLEEAGKLANAVGALQATKIGPMEGIYDLSYIHKFMLDTPIVNGEDIELI